MLSEAAMANHGIINVLHECADGFHEFTSPQIPGFYIVVGQDDLEAAFEDVPNVIRALIHADYGIRVSVTLEQSYSDYLDKLPESHKPTISNYYVEKLAA
jgi:hypothetical protein